MIHSIDWLMSLPYGKSFCFRPISRVHMVHPLLHSLRSYCYPEVCRPGLDDLTWDTKAAVTVPFGGVEYLRSILICNSVQIRFHFLFCVDSVGYSFVIATLSSLMNYDNMGSVTIFG